MTARRASSLFKDDKVERDSRTKKSSIQPSGTEDGSSILHEKKTIKPGRQLVSLKRLRDKKTSDLVEVIEPSRGRGDIVLSPKNVRGFLGLLEEFKHGDTIRRHGLRVRSKLLFCGPPGCGKTLTAEVLAHELGLPLLVARLDSIISSFLGETASNLKNVFDIATREPCVLFLDEFDALARTRSEGSDHSEIRRVVNNLLLMVDRFHGRGFLVAATNLEESLDLAVWRRFDEVFLFDYPRESQIQSLIGLKTRNFPLDFDVKSLSHRLLGLSYADVERVCLNAVKRSILKKKNTVREKEFLEALRDERRRQDVRSRLKPKL